MQVGAALAPWEWYQSISGEILTHLKKKNIVLAQKFTKLDHFEINYVTFNFFMVNTVIQNAS